MKKVFIFILLSLCLMMASCTDSVEETGSGTGVYLLLDTSGTYTKELKKAQQIINFLLGTLGPGDSLVVARIDSGSFSEKDIIAKVTFDSRPSVSNNQKKVFAEAVDKFVKDVKSSQYTDISGGLLQAIEFLNEVKAEDKHVLIYSDLKEELPKGFVRNFDLNLNGFTVQALNVTKLRTDNMNPQEYLDRLDAWQLKVVEGGGKWIVVNDMEREDSLAL